MNRKIFLFSILALIQVSMANEICFDFYKLENSKYSEASRRTLETRERARVYRKKLKTILNEENVRRSSTVLHSTWQKATTYSTRYKLMLDKAGRPITDFELFVKENRVPKEYWDFYRKNSEGKYEEDLVAVPNEYLSPGSLSKNLIGSRSILRQVAELMVSSPKNGDEAYDMIIKALQLTHEDWMRMNPWAKSMRPLHILDLTPDLGLTNVSGPYTLFKEFMNVSDPFHQKILEGFHRHQNNLQAKRLASADQQSIESVYMDLVLKKGTKVPMDEHLEHFFDSKMKTVKQQSGVDHRASSKDLAPIYQRDLDQQIRSALKIYGNYRLKAPDTPPGSGARVFLVVDEAGSVVGALKVQEKNYPGKFAGLDELISALAVEKFIRVYRPEVEVAKTADYGLLNDHSYFSIIEPARQRDLDGWLKSLEKPESIEIILESSAKTLALLHKPAAAQKPSRDAFDTLKGNGLYEVRKAREFLNNSDLHKRTLELGVSERTLEKVKTAVEKAILSYEGKLDTEIEKFSPSTTHGDFHGGNIFYNSIKGKSTLIDAGTLTWTISGTGDPANDLGRIMGHFLIEDLKHQKLDEKTYQRARTFYLKYIEKAKIEFGSKEELILRVSVQFYIHRYFAIQAGDLNGNKFSSAKMSQPELMGQLYSLWLLLDRVTNIEKYIEKDNAA